MCRLKKHRCWNFPGGPAVTTSPSNARGVGLVPSQEAKIHMPHGQKNKKKKKEQEIL